MKVFKYLLIGLVVVLSIILSACTSNVFTGISNDYPKGWPSIVESKGSVCPNISGMYMDKGKFSYQRSGNDSFNSLAYQLGISVTEDIKESKIIVKLSQLMSEELVVEIFSSTRHLGKHVLKVSSADFICEQGIMWQKLQKSVSAEGVGFVSRNMRIGLAQAEDGSLIGQEQLSSAGMVMWMIPTKSKQNFWYLWEQVDKE